MYDTYYALTTFGDPGLKAHVALARFRAELVRLMADEVILPFDLNNYAVFLQRGFNDVVKTYGKLFQQHNISTGSLVVFLLFIFSCSFFSKSDSMMALLVRTRSILYSFIKKSTKI